MERFRGTLSAGKGSHPVEGAIAYHAEGRECWIGALFLPDGAEAAAGGGYRLDVEGGVSVDVVLKRAGWMYLGPGQKIWEAAFMSTGTPHRRP